MGQTHADWEMIIVENHSTDDGPQIAQRYARKDERIHFINAPAKVKGPGAARNEGLRHATGEWVLFLDADDLIEPDHLENLLTCVANHPESDVVAGGWKEFGDDAQQAFQIHRPAGEGRNMTFLRDYSIANAPWAVHAALVKKELIQQQSILWVEELDRLPSEDTAFWFRVTTNGHVAFSKGSGALYRLGISESRNRPEDVESWFGAMKKIIDSNLAFLREKGRQPTSGQCEYIMRRYSDIYLKARKIGARQIATDALALAEAWLHKCRKAGGINTLSLRIRSWLGLRIFLRLIGS